MEYIHRGFNHPNGGVSPAKHAGHYPGNNADHSISDHAKEGYTKAKKVAKKAAPYIKKGAEIAANVATAGTYNAVKGASKLINKKKKGEERMFQKDFDMRQRYGK